MATHIFFARPRELKARGRNGWFDADRIVINNYDDLASVSIYSRKRGNNPPIHIEGNKKDLLGLAKQIYDSLKEE